MVVPNIGLVVDPGALVLLVDNNGDRVTFPTPPVGDVVIVVGAMGEGGDVSSGGPPQCSMLVPH